MVVKFGRDARWEPINFSVTMSYNQHSLFKVDCRIFKTRYGTVITVESES